jgi:pimeloyl-ACP methyl ester carboxylesterase
MTGSKATALFDWASRTGQGCILFDYAGCGASEGAFADQTLESWRDDALAIIDALAPDGPLLLVGSSMGGWLMLLVALSLPSRIAGMVGIAAAPDFTGWGFTPEQKGTLVRTGRLLEPSDYGPEPTLTTLAFWESGQRNRLLDGRIALECPVHLLQGTADAEVPPEIALRLGEALASTEVCTTLVKGGDHRLSRPQDIALLIGAVERLSQGSGSNEAVR